MRITLSKLNAAYLEMFAEQYPGNSHNEILLQVFVALRSRLENYRTYQRIQPDFFESLDDEGEAE